MKNLEKIAEKLAISKKRTAEEAQKSKEAIKQAFLQENATRVVRVLNKPDNFYEMHREMNGKYGWFSSYGKYYNLTEYYTGYQFESAEKLAEFNKIFVPKFQLNWEDF